MAALKITLNQSVFPFHSEILHNLEILHLSSWADVFTVVLLPVLPKLISMLMISLIHFVSFTSDHSLYQFDKSAYPKIFRLAFLPLFTRFFKVWFALRIFRWCRPMELFPGNRESRHAWCLLMVEGITVVTETVERNPSPHGDRGADPGRHGGRGAADPGRHGGRARRRYDMRYTSKRLATECMR